MSEDAEQILYGARFVAAAYMVLWVALVGYVVSVGSRLTKLKRELEAVEKAVHKE